MRSVLAALLLLTAYQPAAAIGLFCTKPEAPSCPVLGKFSSDWDFQSCKSEMESYRQDVELYLSCLADERAAVVSEYNAAVERFNCYARGSSLCY